MKLFLVFLRYKHSSHRYLYILPAETNLNAACDAWRKFKEIYDVHEDDWLVSSLEVSSAEGPQFVGRIDQ